MTKEDAKRIALQDAGEALEDVTFTRNILQEEDGRQVYVEDFYRDDISYHYMIDADTGSIYRRDTRTVERVISKEQGTDVDQETAADSNTEGSPQAPAANSGNDTVKFESGQDKAGNTGQKAVEPESGQADDALEYIGVEHAKSVALEHAGFSKEEVRFEKAKLDHEDGRTVYEIEFKYRGAEYEYKLDARTGSVVERDVDIDED
jgi:uncharacterized membrane protein YkoI